MSLKPKIQFSRPLTHGVHHCQLCNEEDIKRVNDGKDTNIVCSQSDCQPFTMWLSNKNGNIAQSEKATGENGIPINLRLTLAV